MYDDLRALFKSVHMSHDTAYVSAIYIMHVMQVQSKSLSRLCIIYVTTETTELQKHLNCYFAMKF